VRSLESNLSWNRSVVKRKDGSQHSHCTGCAAKMTDEWLGRTERDTVTVSVAEYLRQRTEFTGVADWGPGGMAFDVPYGAGIDVGIGVRTLHR
jgi:hypothetical protein